MDEKTESDKKGASSPIWQDSSANITAPTLGNKTFEDGVSASVDATRILMAQLPRNEG
ncbi:hypothetical protein OH492_12765 [Vibrio chagasii]|nr:hypothetical protein [Vibrio chagasii]